MMKAAVLILLLFILSISHAAVTVQSVYSGSDFIERFDIFNGSIAFINGDNLVYANKSIPTDLHNITDLACSTTAGKCIVSVDFVYKEFVFASGSFTVNNIYRIRDQSNFRIYSKIAIIEGSEYFLVSSLSKYGVNRFKFGDKTSFAQVKFSGMPDTLECLDLLVYPKSKYALVSFTEYNSIVMIDFVNMNQVRSIPGKSGFLAPLTSDISQGYFVSTSENNITKYKLGDGTKIASIRSDYIISGIKNVQYTDFVIVATWEQVYIYNFAGTNVSVWTAIPYYYELANKQMTGGVKWDQAEAKMYFSGYGHITSLSDTNTNFCHPECNGCSLMLSDYKCTACTTNSTLQESQCKLPTDQIKAPPGGVIDYANADWSNDNKIKDDSKGFNIKDYYLYIVIGAGGLVGLCCIFCIVRMCCKKDEDKKNRVNNDKNNIVSNNINMLNFTN